MRFANVFLFVAIVVCQGCALVNYAESTPSATRPARTMRVSTGDTLVEVEGTKIALSVLNQGKLFQISPESWAAVGCARSRDLQHSTDVAAEQAANSMWNTLSVLAHNPTYVEKLDNYWVLKRVSRLEVSVDRAGYARIGTRISAVGETYHTCVVVKPSLPVTLEMVRTFSSVEIVP